MKDMHEIQPWRDEQTMKYLRVDKEKTQQEIADLFGVHIATIQKWASRFNLGRVGLSGAPVKYTDEEMLEWIESFIDVIGVVPADEDIRGWPGPSHKCYEMRFGSVAKAVKELGYEPRGKVKE